MRWLFNEFMFDSNTRLLTIDDEVVLLEPKVAQLLAYFCENQQQDINRDQLLTHVWNNQIVTENAINRVVGLLRKVLRDEHKIKHTIATVPKVGYRFIANAAQLPDNLSLNKDQELPQEKDHQGQRNKGDFLKRHVSKILIVVIVLLVTLSAWHKQNKHVITNPNVEPVTRLSANQYDAQYANSTQRLIYSSHRNKFQTLFLTSLQQIAPQGISQPGGHATKGRWAHDDSSLVYLFKNKENCEFHQVDFINRQPQPPRVIYQCPANTVTDFAISHDNQTLYFVKQAAPFSPYALHALNIADGQLTKTPQPTAVGKGNHQFDLSANGQEILLLSDQQAGKTSFYRLNIASEHFQKLLTLDYFVDSAIWGHQPNSIVHQGPHPSSTLMVTLLNNSNEHLTTQTLVSDTRRINNVTRINNQKDYAFSSYIYNNDITLNDHNSAVINSSVTDFLPALSPDGSQLAFISKRSGDSKVWLYHLTSKLMTTFKPLAKGRRYLSLQWSFDGKRLLANTSNELVIFDVASTTIEKNIPLSIPAYNATWVANDAIAYSHKQQEGWQLNYYNISTNLLSQEDPQWAFVLSSPSQQLFFNQDLKPFHHKETQLTALPCRFSIIRSKLTAQLDNNDLYCQSNQKSSELVKVENLKVIQRNVQKIPSMGFIDFSVVNNQQALTKLTDSSSDIMRTRF
jgi:transcriptional activator of cad operon